MNSKERFILELLKSYTILQDDAERLEESLKTSGYSITAHYGIDGGGGGGQPTSKVENHALRIADLERRLKDIRGKLTMLQDAMEHSGLNKRERDLLDCTIKGYSLSAYARARSIYKSHVYKIRDKALRKMVKYIANNTK